MREWWKLKAELTLTSIGGFKGKRKFSLESGTINFVLGSNASGKSSLIRGLGALLSIPPDGDISDFHQVEAIHLGLRSEERSAQEGFVNVHSPHGTVTLTFNSTETSYKVDRDGNFLTLPEIGDQRFLLTGILSKNSRVLRQIREGKDDFTWAVTKLSRAKAYEEILDVALTYHEDTERRLNEIKTQSKELQKASQEKEQLLKKLDSIESRIKKSKGKADKARPILEEKEKLARKIEEKKSARSDITRRIKEQKEKRTAQEAHVQKLRKELVKIDDERERVQSETDPKALAKRHEEIDEAIAKLANQRNTIDGELNLLVTASVSLRKQGSGTVDCPLCKDGKISLAQLERELQRCRSEKDTVNVQIEELSLEKRRRQKTYDDKIDELKTLDGEIESIKEEIEVYETHGGIYDPSVDQEELKTINSDILASEKELKTLTSQDDDDKIVLDFDKLLEERGAIKSKIREIDDVLQSTTIYIEDREFSLENAQTYYEQANIFLGQSIDHLRNRIEEHRRKAADAFNTNITELLNRLRFSEFRTVKLNKDYRLFVERKRPDGKDYDLQQLQTLSASEQIAVALVLQLALRETYFPDSKFLLLDDVLVEFDEDRVKEVIRYLVLKAKTEDWFLVATMPKEEIDGVQVTTYNEREWESTI